MESADGTVSVIRESILTQQPITKKSVLSQIGFSVMVPA
jgi:hypothetical protein